VLPSVPPKIRLEKEAQGGSVADTRGGHQATRGLSGPEGPALVDLVELALYTGLRQGELLGTQLGLVDRARGVVLLEVTRNGRRREVPLQRASGCRPGPRARGRLRGARVQHSKLGRLQEGLGGGRLEGRQAWRTSTSTTSDIPSPRGRPVGVRTHGLR